MNTYTRTKTHRERETERERHTHTNIQTYTYIKMQRTKSATIDNLAKNLINKNNNILNKKNSNNCDAQFDFSNDTISQMKKKSKL